MFDRKTDSMLPTFGKLLIILGVIAVIAGVIMVAGPKIPYIGKLPGDIYIKRDNFVFYFPLTTCILVSIVIYFLMKLFR